MMLKTLFLFVALLPLSLGAMTQAEADSLAARGTKAYAAGDHVVALQYFDSVATVFASASLYYNLGNCHFKLNDIPHAILNYERALRLSPGDADVQANLELARQSVVDRVNELPMFTLGSTWGKVRGGRDADQWARRSLWACLLFFALLALAISLHQRTLRRILICASALAFVATLLSITFAAYRHKEVTDHDQAIITSAKVDVRSGPTNSSTTLFVLHKGTKVTILQEVDAWSEVQLSNGNVGWMPPSSLERI